VPSLDDDRLERYLKQFRPRIPEALPVEAERRISPHVRKFAIWAAALVALVTAVGLEVHHGHKTIHSVSGNSSNPSSMGQISTVRGLTLRDADASLRQATSFKAAIDDMAWRHQRPSALDGQQSALAVLGKENFKL
jgi:hypothetical protein